MTTPNVYLGKDAVNPGYQSAEHAVLNVHGARNVELGRWKRLTTSDGSAFEARSIKATDEYGRTHELVLFRDCK